MAAPPSLAVSLQMHIVSVKAVHPNVTAALGDPTGLAVLGVFIDVSQQKCNHLDLQMC